jgi:hypothetical protein
MGTEMEPIESTDGLILISNYIPSPGQWQYKQAESHDTNHNYIFIKLTLYA